MDLNATLRGPPPGVTPNFDHSESRGSIAIAGMTICLVFMMLSVLMRIHTKLFITHTFGWDDYACILASIGSIAYAALALSTLKHGMGMHDWNVRLAKIGEDGFKLYFAAAVVHNPTIFFVRLSVFLFYLRLFGPKRKMRICVYIGIATSLLYLTTLTVVLMAYSIPREGENWIAVDLRAMMAGQRMAIALAVLNAVSDLYILCIPIPVIWGLQLSARDKIGLTVVFMTASLAWSSSVASMILRIKYFGFEDSNTDISWQTLPIQILTSAESTVGLISACMPICAPLFRQALGFMHHLQPRSLRLWPFWKFKDSSSEQMMFSDEASPPQRYKQNGFRRNRERSWRLEDRIY